MSEKRGERQTERDEANDRRELGNDGPRLVCSCFPRSVTLRSLHSSPTPHLPSDGLRPGPAGRVSDGRREG